MSGLKFADRFLIKSNRHQDWDYVSSQTKRTT